MAKEYVIEKAFQPKNDDGSVKSWNSTKGGEMHVWKVKVEGQDFWFDLNKKAGNEITPGDTLYGIFDEEEYTVKSGPNAGEKRTSKKFVKLNRPDGSYDKVQSRGESQAPSQGTHQTDPNLEARLKRLEDHLGLPPIEWSQEDKKQQEPEEEQQFKAEDLPL